ncbi:MAG: helix-hairpin-helix domain-containing protein [Promethearchaeota archaeon]
MTHVSQSLEGKKIKKEADPLVPSIGREDITVIKGIGASMAIKLRNHGFGTITSLSETTAGNLARRVEGIGEASAQKFINQARIIKQSKDLVDFTEDKNELDHSPTVRNKVIENSEPSLDEIHSDSGPITPRVNLISELTSSTLPIVEDFIGEEEKEEINDHFEFGQVEDEPMEIEDPHFGEEVEENLKLDQDMNFSNLEDPQEGITEAEAHKTTMDRLYHEELLLPQRSVEMLEQGQIQELYNTINKELESYEFFIVKKIPELRSLFTGIDLIGVKLVRVKEYLDLIYIVPVKVCPLKGNVILNENSVSYQASEIHKNYHYNLNQVLGSHLQALLLSEQNIFENCSQEGNLLKFISRYLHIEVSLKKTIMRENLFFHSGPLQYKILIEPLLVCQNKVGFTEKLIPFAYHKSTNIHVVQISDLSNLLQFLDQKYFLIETYTEKENTLTKYNQSFFKFMNHLRLLSLPFIGYGFILLSCLLFQSFRAISFLVNFGYGIIALYGITFSYIYIKFHQEKSILRNELSTPYFQKKREYDETTLILINEELSPKLMEQFIYESVGNHTTSKTVSKVEQKNAEVYLEQKVTERAVKNANLFESGKISISKSKNDPPLEDQIKERYISFLED